MCGGFLIVSLPPIFDMGDMLKEGENDLFSIGKIIDRKNNLLEDLPISSKHLHLSDLQIQEYKN